MIFNKELQDSNAPFPIVPTPFDILTNSKSIQFLNTSSPIVVTLSGSTIVDSLQLRKPFLE